MCKLIYNICNLLQVLTRNIIGNIHFGQQKIIGIIQYCFIKIESLKPKCDKIESMYVRSELC